MPKHARGAEYRQMYRATKSETRHQQPHARIITLPEKKRVPEWLITLGQGFIGFLILYVFLFLAALG